MYKLLNQLAEKVNFSSDTAVLTVQRKGTLQYGEQNYIMVAILHPF